jgi:hypothetical protein
LDTQVSVALAGNWQVLAGGRLQLLAGIEQVLVVAVHVLSLCMLHVADGRLHTSGVPVHRFGGGVTQ